MNKLQGKTDVIKGGNSGIGFATAQLFLQEVATVIIASRRVDAIKEEIQKLGERAHGIVSDSGKMNDVNSLYKKVAELTSVIDILFVNAGVGLFAPFDQTSEQIFDDNVNINFKGAFFTIQRLLP